MTIPNRRCIAGSIAIYVMTVAMMGCGLDEAAKVAGTCAEVKCPGGATPHVDASAVAQCGGGVTSEVSLSGQKEGLTGSCYAEGTCTIVCVPPQPCCGGLAFEGDSYTCEKPQPKGPDGGFLPCDEGCDCSERCGTITGCKNGSIDCGFCKGGNKCSEEKGLCVDDCSEENICGKSCCAAGSVCKANECCPAEANCAGKECGDDGCGGTCGVCDSGKACTEGKCEVPSDSCAGAPDTCSNLFSDMLMTCKKGTDGFYKWKEYLYCPGVVAPTPFCVETANGAKCGQCRDNADCPDGSTCNNMFKCSCTQQCQNKQCGDDGCNGLCGTCDDAANEVCIQDLCECISDCTGKKCGDDGCGNADACGVCEAGLGCSNGSCVSVDNCGDGACVADDNENCSSCSADCSCSAGDSCVDSACCTPACTGKSCGSNGCGGSCGNCVDADCENGQCVCTPKCSGACDVADGCGSQCACAEGETCVGAEGDGVCCAPSCSGKSCGSNGCGGSCGGCDQDQACENGQCVSVKSCGDGNCSSQDNENCLTCTTDCSCSVGNTCTANGKCCKPVCGSNQCGTDGCGGSCGLCQNEADICIDGQCDCISQCDSITCGKLDGCGQQCGCIKAEVCSPDGKCCKTKCEGKSCGSNGCGGNCGQCEAGLDCSNGQCIEANLCGNKSCEPAKGEDCASCPSDCGCEKPAVCNNGTCCQPQCAGKNCGPDGCGGSCGPCNGTCNAGVCNEGSAIDCNTSNDCPGHYAFSDYYAWVQVTSTGVGQTPRQAQAVVAQHSGYLMGVQALLSQGSVGGKIRVEVRFDNLNGPLLHPPNITKTVLGGGVLSMNFVTYITGTPYVTKGTTVWMVLYADAANTIDSNWWGSGSNVVGDPATSDSKYSFDNGQTWKAHPNDADRSIKLQIETNYCYYGDKKCVL